ncbi:hypothetical protein CDEST_04845 [Colletotrichum destructivum]|uniref:Uncharacterized protein n=1 Tax=Colletotrichum destructivum TaxID=34406 RepID=A0AAX4I9I2_9PEZI|nr:hypothetical protein CDEST_04845 [Colletotrichum destructivum]
MTVVENVGRGHVQWQRSSIRGGVGVLSVPSLALVHSLPTPRRVWEEGDGRVRCAVIELASEKQGSGNRCWWGEGGGDREKKSLREVSKGCGSVSVAGAGSGRDEGERESERFREIRRQHRSSGDRDVPRTVDGMGRRVWRQEESEARQGTAMGTTDDSRPPAHCLFSGESRHSLELCPLARGNGEGERVGMGSCVRMLAPQTEYVHDYD